MDDGDHKEQAAAELQNKVRQTKTQSIMKEIVNRICCILVKTGYIQPQNPNVRKKHTDQEKNTAKDEIVSVIKSENKEGIQRHQSKHNVKKKVTVISKNTEQKLKFSSIHLWMSGRYKKALTPAFDTLSSKS